MKRKAASAAAGADRGDAPGKWSTHAILYGQSAAHLWRSRRWIRVAVFAVVAVLLNLMTWPLAMPAPGVGLDASWQIALHLAAENHANYGQEIGFTYGPLGFLLVPQLVTSPTFLMAFSATLVLRTSLILAVLVASRRAFGSTWLAVGLAYVVGVLLSVELTEVPGLLAVVVALVLIQTPCVGNRSGQVCAVLLGVGAALVVLMKLDGGVVAIVALCVTAWFQGIGRWRALASWALGFAGAFLALWLATGNRLVDVPRWVSWSWSIATGYTEAAMLETPGRDWEYPAYLVLAAALIALAAFSWRRRPGVQQAALALVLLFGLWTAFKHGFVRHDSHVWFSFVTVSVLPAAILWHGRVLRVAGLALIAFGLVFTFRSWGVDAGAALNPEGRPSAAFREARLVVDGSRRRARIRAAQDAVRVQLAIDPRIIRAIGRDTVHIAPQETSAAWAYGLNWRPIPNFQSYSTWTGSLDEANRAFLLGPNAPRYVLRQDVPRYDHHNPVFESPAENLALLCRYRDRLVIGAWELLERGIDRCGSTRRLGSTVAEAGVPVAVPGAQSDEIVYARIRWNPGLVQRIRAFAFKPERQPAVRPMGKGITPVFRIPAPLLDGPLVLRAPASVQAPPRIRALLDADRLLIKYPRRARVDFYATTLQGQ